MPYLKKINSLPLINHISYKYAQVSDIGPSWSSCFVSFRLPYYVPKDFFFIVIGAKIYSPNYFFFCIFSDHAYKGHHSPLCMSNSSSTGFHFISESDSGTSSTTPPSSPLRCKNKKGRSEKMFSAGL